MDLSWIKPLRRPPGREAFRGLSCPAMKVLTALRARYEDNVSAVSRNRTPGRGLNLYEGVFGYKSSTPREIDGRHCEQIPSSREVFPFNAIEECCVAFQPDYDVGDYHTVTREQVLPISENTLQTEAFHDHELIHDISMDQEAADEEKLMSPSSSPVSLYVNASSSEEEVDNFLSSEEAGGGGPRFITQSEFPSAEPIYDFELSPVTNSFTFSQDIFGTEPPLIENAPPSLDEYDNICSPLFSDISGSGIDETKYSKWSPIADLSLAAEPSEMSEQNFCSALLNDGSSSPFCVNNHQGEYNEARITTPTFTDNREPEKDSPGETGFLLKDAMLSKDTVEPFTCNNNRKAIDDNALNDLLSSSAPDKINETPNETSVKPKECLGTPHKSVPALSQSTPPNSIAKKLGIKDINKSAQDKLSDPVIHKNPRVSYNLSNNTEKSENNFLKTVCKRALASPSMPLSKIEKKKGSQELKQQKLIDKSKKTENGLFFPSNGVCTLLKAGTDKEPQQTELQSATTSIPPKIAKTSGTEFKTSNEDKSKQSTQVFDSVQPVNKEMQKDQNTYKEKRKPVRKFKVPYGNSMGIKNDDYLKFRSKPKDGIRQLCQESALELKAKLDEAAPIETALTILFKGGFTQLNKPKQLQVCHPEAVLLRVEWTSETEVWSISWTSSISSAVLKSLLLSEHRNVCYDAQEMCQLLVDKFFFSANEVSLELLLLDPMVGCWLLNPDEPPSTFDDVTNFLKMDQTFACAPRTDQLLKRLSKSAEYLYRCLSANGLWKLFLHLEMRITPILACMEIHGMHVDIHKLKDMAQQLQRSLSLLQREACKTTGKNFQLTSPHQLSTILYDELKLDIKSNIKVKETLKRQFKSTSESTLVQFKEFHPLPGIIIEYRKLHKLKSTYVDAILEQASGNCIRPKWNHTSVATGRIVSTDPNLQATPKHPLELGNPPDPVVELSLRSVYLARPGCSFIAADFQHIELRVFAHLSKDVALIEALHQPHDIFLVLAQCWLGCKSIEEVSTEDRNKTKRIVYALMYGAGPSKLMEFLHISYQQASKILSSFTAIFPSLEEFTRNTSQKCKSQGYLATECGRRRWFPNIKNVNSQLQMHAERQAVNFLIQGTAADICKCAMVQAQRRLVTNAIEARLLLQIHDELLWEVKDSDIQKAAGVVQSAMEESTIILPSLSSFSVPLPVIVKEGKTWANMTVVKRTSFGLNSQPVNQSTVTNTL